jgi:hemolysin activation/secretion protein
MRAGSVLLSLGLFSMQSVLAQSLPSYLNSNDTERNLPAPNLPADAYRPKRPDLQVPEPAADQQLVMGTRVMVRQVQIQGGSIYPLEELAEIYKPLVGRETRLGELIKVTRGITQRYRDDGYLLSYAFLPQQSFDQGVVRVVLVEGYVKGYQVQGDIGPVSAYVDKLLKRIQAERPLTRATFERYTSLISAIPGISFSAQVPPPTTTDGASQMVASASRKPFSSHLGLAEGNSDSTQALLTVGSNAQTSQAEQIGATLLFPPGSDEERYYRFDYSQYLGSEGTQFSLFASHYESEPNDPLILNNGLRLERQRENDRLSLGLSHPWVASPTRWWSTTGRLYAVKDKTRFDVIGFPLSIDSETDIRVLALESEWRESDAKRLRIFSGGLYRGIDGMGANSDTELFDLDFLRVRLAGVQSDRFGQNWQGVMSTAMYWSDDSLPDAEQAVFGGQNFGRGYPSDQANGDKGWGAAYEINYSYRFEAGGPWVRQLQPYVVIDTARVWFNEQPVPRAHLSSAAIGLRFGDARYYNVSLEAAKPMSDKAIDSRDRSPRYSVSFSYQL